MAQTPQSRVPSVSYGTGFIGKYGPGDVSHTEYQNSQRIRDLIRAGQIYLSLQDAIALALENNLDVELSRYGVDIARTDTLRARGGGTLRNVQLTTLETPAGLGGPGAPLQNAAATGSTPQSNVSPLFSDAQSVQQAQDNLAVTGTFALATGPIIPQFDPAITGTFVAQHLSAPQVNPSSIGAASLTTNAITGNGGYVQGFSPGTTLVAAFQNSRTNQNSNRNLINPYENAALGFTVTQPLLRGFGRQINRRFIRIAEINEQNSRLVFQYQAQVTVAGVIRLYIDLVSLGEDLKVKRQTLATAQRLADDNASKVEQGTLAPIELTRAQAQVAAAQQDLINADGFVRQQELILKDVLTRDVVGDPLVRSARIIPTDTLQVQAAPSEDPANLLQTALLSRPDYISAKLQIESSQIQLEGSRNSLRPQLDLVGNMTNNGLAGPYSSIYTGTPGVPPGLGGYGTALEQILRRDYPSYSIGLNLTLPVHNRVAQADAIRDELQLRQSEVRTRELEKLLRLQVENALIALQRTRSAYEAAQQTRKLQEQSLDIENERFDVGLSTNFLVIQYAGFVAQARSTEVAALGAYAKARSRLDSVIGTILSVNGVDLDEAYRGQISRPPSPIPANAPATPAIAPAPAPAPPGAQ
jgi:outer membrane protein TolC